LNNETVHHFTITWQTNSKEIDPVYFWSQDENPGKTPKPMKFTDSKATRYFIKGLK